jgi:plastocyanin
MTRAARSTAILAGAMALAASVAACGGYGSTSTRKSAGAEGRTVTIKTFIFRPNPLRLKPGTKVTWHNTDDIVHTVTAGRRGHPTGAFDAQLNLGDTFSSTFTKPGTYPYVCTIHMGMDAEVVVG